MIPANHGKKWEKSDYLQLANIRALGGDVPHIAKVMGRSEYAIILKLEEVEDPKSTDIGVYKESEVTIEKLTDEERRIADNAILTINNDKEWYDKARSLLAERGYVPNYVVRDVIRENGDSTAAVGTKLDSPLRSYINSKLNSNEGWGYKLKYPYPHPIDQFDDEPTEEKPMTQLNFERPVENVTRVFGVEIYATLADEELISMIRNARNYVDGFADMTDISKKVKAKCESIEVGIKLLIKALDKETGE